MFESIIHLNAFDESRFNHIKQAVESTGIRIFSLTEAGDTPEARYQLYELNRTTALDDPASPGVFPPYEEFCKTVFQARWFCPGGQILAADGDRYVGISAVGYFAETNSMYNMITGVDRAYRGQKIAQALKLHTICFAKICGADYIRTHNDSQNDPMLAINRKLGYVVQPSEAWRYKKVA